MRKQITKAELFDAFDSASVLELNDADTFESVLDMYKETQTYKNKPRRFEERLARTFRDWQDHRAKRETEPTVAGTLASPEDLRQWAEGTTFVFTCAQSNTFLNDKFWMSLMHLVEDRDAELHISRITYNKANHGKNSVKPGTKKASDTDDLWFDPRIEPYISDESVFVTRDLVWCGELNIIPTRVNPITGFENYGRGASVIIPHNKMALRSIPTMKFSEPQFAYSTGTVTARNYIEKAAGQKASLHHVYGALLVEVDTDGNWWARQLNADGEGNVYDLTDLYTPDGKQVDRDVAVVTHGDLHGNKLNLDIADAMVDVLARLRPDNQVFHDTVDFQSRNHHNIKDPHFLHKMLVEGTDDVMDEFRDVAKVMREKFWHPDCDHWIITSNHDQAIETWLRNPVGFSDPQNMELWLALNLYCANERKAGNTPRPFMELLNTYLEGENWHFIHEDESLVICDIEHGMHGHLGPNGARGTPANLRTAGKANTGHTHSCGIVDGVYTAGVFGDLDMGYNKGLSSWSHSFIVTYRNGKRAILTFRNGKAWRD